MTTLTLPSIVLDGLCWDDEDDSVRWVMAQGHVDRAAFRASAVDFLGIAEQDVEDFPAVEKIEHRWAIDADRSGCVDWVDVTESTPGAYAVTLLDVNDLA